MKPGGTLHIKPNFYTEYGMTDELRPQPCRVVYIHPERRFYVVESVSYTHLTLPTILLV